ncbi:MAG: hypothetical protein ABIW80_09405, partial [Lapillicoccus sp.]
MRVCRRERPGGGRDRCVVSDVGSDEPVGLAGRPSARRSRTLACRIPPVAPIGSRLRLHGSG